MVDRERTYSADSDLNELLVLASHPLKPVLIESEGKMYELRIKQEPRFADFFPDRFRDIATKSLEEMDERERLEHSKAVVRQLRWERGHDDWLDD